MTNPASPAGTFYFTKSGSSLVGQWTPPPQSGFGGFAPSIVSVLTSSNNPYVGQFTGTFTGNGATVSNVVVQATNVTGLPSITNFLEIVGQVPSAGTLVQFTGTTNTDGSVQTTNVPSNGTGNFTNTLTMLPSLHPVSGGLVIFDGTTNASGGLNVKNATNNVVLSGTLIVSNISASALFGDGSHLSNITSTAIANYVVNNGTFSTNFIATQGITDSNRISGAYTKMQGGDSLLTNISPAAQIHGDTNGNLSLQWFFAAFQYSQIHLAH